MEEEARVILKEAAFGLVHRFRSLVTYSAENRSLWSRLGKVLHIEPRPEGAVSKGGGHIRVRICEVAYLAFASAAFQGIVSARLG